MKGRGNWKLVAFFVAVAIVIAIIWGQVQKNNSSDETVKSAVGANVSYDADAEVEAALKKLNEGCDSAKIIRDKAVKPTVETDSEETVEVTNGETTEEDAESDETKEKKEVRVALMFQGLAENSVNARVLDLLENYSVSATFFVPGLMAAEDEETVQTIVKEGHDLGNNGLAGESYMEEMSADELVDNFERSEKILSIISGKTPDLLYCNSTLYTDNVTQAATAAGYDKVVLPTTGHYLNYSSFTKYDQALNFVNKLEGDTLVVIKMQGPLDLLEYEPRDPVSTPADDMQPGIDNTETIVVDEENVVQVVEWLLKAVMETETETAMVRDFEARTNDEYIEELLANGEGTKAEVYHDVLTQEQAIGLSFTGVPTEEEMVEIVNLLTEKEAKATFVVTGEEAVANKELWQTAINAGFTIGNAGMTGESMASKSAREIYDEIMLGDRKEKAILGIRTKYYFPLDKKESENMKLAAGVMGYSVVIPANPSIAAAGSLYSVDIGQEGSQIADVEAILKKAGSAKLAVYDIPEIILSSKRRPEISQETLDELREANEGKLSFQREMIYTTEKAMSFLFYGIENKPVLKDVLSVLKSRNYSGTFFATLEEMEKYPEHIQMILDSGSEVGICYTPSASEEEDFDTAARYILTTQNYLEWRYGITTNLVKLPYGEPSDALLEAISATDCRLIGHEYTMIQSKNEEAENVYTILNTLGNTFNFKRGALVYFHMNYLAQDKLLERDYEGKTLCGELLRRIIWNEVDTMTYVDYTGQKIPETAYSVKSYSKVAYTGSVYGLNYSAQNKISANYTYMSSLATEEKRFQHIVDNYLGNPDTNAKNQLPGFTDQEINRLDKAGIATGEKVLFLTFDDWGTDYSINQLLYVLKKHDVKATFFVRTNYVYANPNLLRAIAAEGHEIASHTHAHIPLANVIEEQDPSSNDPEDKIYTYYNLSDAEAYDLRNDCVNSYNILHRYVGNVVIDGKPALSTHFRPPTLAMSKIGISNILDVGFTHVVSGDFSTHDYEAGSVEALVDTLRNGRKLAYGTRRIKPGSTIVMHMSEEAQFTAEALDIMIPEWKSQGYRFARVDDYLQ